MILTCTLIQEEWTFVTDSQEKMNVCDHNAKHYGVASHHAIAWNPDQMRKLHYSLETPKKDLPQKKVRLAKLSWSILMKHSFFLAKLKHFEFKENSTDKLRINFNSCTVISSRFFICKINFNSWSIISRQFQLVFRVLNCTTFQHTKNQVEMTLQELKLILHMKNWLEITVYELKLILHNWK